MILIIWFSKFIIFILRFLKLGGGTSLPGLFIEKYSPGILTRLTKDYRKIVLITGTNGKTTTQQFLRHLLESKNLKVCSNNSGANLIRGIAVTVISDCSVFGKSRSNIAVFEVEEATMPIITKLISPSHIIVTNLFRDQLDAYGEILKTRSYILRAIKQSPKAQVFLNGDDKNVSSIASEIKNEVTLFSLRDKRKYDIFFERAYFRFKSREGIKRVYARNIKIEEDLSTRFSIFGLRNVVREVHFNAPGLQNVYNAVAGLCVAESIRKFKDDKLKVSFSQFMSAFGRGEIVKVSGKQIRLLLVKNPASFTANLNMLKHLLSLKLLIIINDNVADGTDVSWLWDTNIEMLQKADISWITISGTRAYDMALRLKYADVHPISVEVEPGITRALDISLSRLREEDTLFVLPTYTAMFRVRKAIGNIVKIREFWR